jgi:hypothetical protein
VGDLLKIRQQTINASSQRFANALLIFIVREEVESAVESLELFFQASYFGERSLNFVQHLCVLVERKVPAPESSDELVEVVDPLAAPDEKLSAAPIANGVRLAIPISSYIQELAAKNTRHFSHGGRSGTSSCSERLTERD